MRTASRSQFVQEDFFKPSGYGQYPLIMKLRDGIFTPVRPISTYISWPRAANFAVWGVDVRSRPLKVRSHHHVCRLAR